MTGGSPDESSAAPRAKAPALRRVSAIALVLVAITLSHEVVVPREREWSTRAMVFAIEQYRHHVSPHLKGRIVCRFTPTCSAYGLASVKKHGALRGGWRAVTRIARCNPMTPAGTVDEP